MIPGKDEKMEIVKINTADDAKLFKDCYFEFDGAFYAQCWNCGKLVQIDSHRTVRDLDADIDSEEQYFCDQNCLTAYAEACPGFEAAAPKFNK